MEPEPTPDNVTAVEADWQGLRVVDREAEVVPLPVELPRLLRKRRNLMLS